MTYHKSGLGIQRKGDSVFELRLGESTQAQRDERPYPQYKKSRPNLTRPHDLKSRFGGDAAYIQTGFYLNLASSIQSLLYFTVFNSTFLLLTAGPV